MVILGFSLTLQINLTFRSVLCLLQNCLESMESPRVPIFTSTVSVSAHKTVQFIWHNHWHISVPPNPCPTLESGVSSLKFGSSTDMCPPLQCETEQVNSVSWAESLSYANAQWFAHSEQNCWLFDDLSLPHQCCSLLLSLSFLYRMSCSSPDT